MTKDKDSILDSFEDKPIKKKKKTKVESKAIEKNENEVKSISLKEDDVALPSSPHLLSRLKESVFEEGLHYITQEKKGIETIFFKKQASSVLAELFSLNVRIVSSRIESFIPPATKYTLDKIFESTQELIREGKMKTAGGLINYAKDLATDKNPAEWWRAEVVLEANNGKRSLQWTASATSALENVALSTAMTRCFRNLIRIFGGL